MHVPAAHNACKPVALDWLASPLGPLITAATADAVCLLEFAGEDTLQSRLETLRQRYAASLLGGTNLVLGRLHAQLQEYFSGTRREFAVPLVYPGTPFQEKVWSMLQQIRYGETWSYLDLALRLGDAKATRAVGTANGANPIAIVIPCHRVVNADGKLGGYGGGSWRKRLLLDLECGQGRLAV